MRSRTAAIVFAALAAPALAQSVTADSTITLALSWHEGPGGNNNGVLDAGEIAVITLDASFSNQNSVANFTPTIGTFASGTIRGFGSGFLDLHGSGGAQGTWNVDPFGNPSYGVDPAWDIAGAEGTPGNGGADLNNIQMGQFSASPGAITTTNPIRSIWSGLWTPGDYSGRQVTFTLAGNPAAGQFVASVFLRLTPTLAGPVYVDAAHLSLGSVTIPIGIPAPPAALVLTLAVFPVRRSDRR